MSGYNPNYHHVSKLDRSDGQRGRYIRNANRLLARLRDEFGYEQEFTVSDVLDAIGSHLSDEGSKKLLAELRQSFNNLRQRKMLDRNGNWFVISEEGRQFLEHVELDDEDE